MVRTQVQLPEEELARLRQMAAEERVSVSELVRRGVRQVLRSRRRPSREELWKRALKVAGEFSSGRGDISERHDDYFVEGVLSEWRK